jgi:hypothetical protein
LSDLPALVEDPNENFSDLRDKNDVRMLTEANAFEGIKAPVSDEFVETMRKRFKLTKVRDGDAWKRQASKWPY